MAPKLLSEIGMARRHCGSVKTGTMLNAFTHQTQVRALAFSPDGNLLAIGSEDGIADLWNVEDRDSQGDHAP